ncbi:ribonuclease III [Pararhizobium mangrovi]|uniref:Ribonuclease 3 n=1 Tax=Pararhizobium mangrovi TaxID=2590452 RepID=A0A506UC45_9HYPH|nr:ribonuclease III [Pararhizobium mangrovi]TPW32002.1 ribonuclease III [Pararhizobium mangrovi]
MKRLGDHERARLEARIGIVFKDKARLDRALTHASALGPDRANYERLEFLGDRVLGLCIAELLFKRFSEAREGELSVRLNQLVSAETCALVADELGLHAFIRTGSDVKKLTSRRMANVRADVMESLIGAIYLDQGLEAARGFILANWEERSVETAALRRDAKTELQEWSHARFAATPAYTVTDRSGPDHDPSFTVRVTVGNLAPETGTSRSKRAAEQEAAGRLLEREKVWSTQ